MIESIQFRNFRVLRDATLPLGRCTILVGPNGSGKTTVLQAIDLIREPNRLKYGRLVTLGVPPTKENMVEVRVNWGGDQAGAHFPTRWLPPAQVMRGTERTGRGDASNPERLDRQINRFRVFTLEARAIAAPATVTSQIELGSDGANLAAVLDGIRDTEPGRFAAIDAELPQWLPEFDQILFDTPSPGRKSIALRTRGAQHKVPAADLSQGTLIALALLTLAYLPEPPCLVGLEEPDRGIHPRLLRHVQDAIYRLAYPENFGEKREPVQVIATTHSPYFLDLFRDHPEEVVVADKTGNEVKFEPLSQRSDIREILSEAPLGEAWYTGVLGGVPSEP